MDTFFAMARRYLFRLVPALGILLCLWTLFLGGLRLVAEIPATPIREHLEEAYHAHALQKMYPRLGFHRLELYTECDAAGIALLMQPSFESVLRMEHYGACDALSHALAGETLSPVGYPRYWHGSQLLLRPLLATLPWWAIPCAVGLITVTVFIAFIRTMYRCFGRERTLILLAAFFPAATLNLFVLSVHAPVFLLIMLSCIVLLRTSIKNTSLLFLCIGTLDAFFSFLNQPSLSFGLPVLLLVLIRHLEKVKPSRILVEFLTCGVAWSFGFVATWLFKWGLATLFVPDASIFGPHLETIHAYTARQGNAFFVAVTEQFRVLTKKLFLPVLVWMLWRLYKGHRRPDPGLWVLLFPAAVPFVWYALLPSMVDRHAWFMHISLWPFLASTLLILFGMPTGKETPWREIAKDIMARMRTVCGRQVSLWNR